MTTRGTRWVNRSALAALVLGAAGIVAHGPSGPVAEALTTGVWVDRGPSNERVAGTAMSADGSIAYVVSDYINSVRGAGRVSRSTDSTATWTAVDDVPAGEWSAVTTSADGSDVVVVGRTASGSSPHRIWVSGDGGATWTDRTPDPDAVYADTDITSDGSTIVVTTPSGVIQSDDGGENWSSLPGFPVNPEHVAVGRSGASVTVHAAYAGSVHTWRTGDATASSTLTPAGTIVDLDASDTGQVVMAATSSPHTAQVSTDGGQNWTSQAQSGRTNAHVNVAVSGDGSSLALSSYGESLIESSDGGATWAVADNPDQRAFLALGMSGDGRHLLAGRENEPLRVRIPTPAPTISSIAPTEGPASGGTTITIGGTHFYDVVSVSIGGVAATSFTRTSVGEISAVTPSGAVGSAAVTVTTAHGTFALSSGFIFYATAAPDITVQSHDAGTHLGGQTITLDGTGLAEVTAVTIGDRVATIVSATRTRLTVRTPTNRVGIMDIAVESPFGRHVIDDGWTSTWEERSRTPQWSEIDDRTGYAFELVDDGADGLYIGGDFLDTAAIRWDGRSTVNPVSNGVVIGSAFSERFFAYGVQAIMPTSDGAVWLGGSLATWVGQSPVESPLVKVAPSGEPTPAPALDGMVLALAPGASATTLIAGGLFTGTVAELDIDDGTWTVLGGSAFGPGTYEGSARSVTALARRANGRLLAGGTFTLANSPNQSGDLVAEWDGTSWRPVIPALPGEMATSFDVGTIDGEEVVAISTGGISDNGFGEISVSGRVLLLHADDTVETIGTFSSLVRDVAIVDDTVVAVGYFNSALGTGEPRQANYAGVLVDGDWIDLGVADGANFGLDTVDVLGDDRVVVGGWHQRIDGTTDLAGLAVSTPITALLAAAMPLTVTSVDGSFADDDGIVTVTVTGAGFDDDTDATIDDRPVDALDVISSTELRFTTTASDTERSVGIYGIDSTATARLAATPDRPAPDSPESDDATNETSTPESTSTTSPMESTVPSTTPATVLPTLEAIAALPMVTTMIPADAQLTPGASLAITADGFVAGETVSVVIASEPRLLGTATVASDGSMSTSVSLPTDLLGAHTLIVWSPTTGRGVRQAITIASPTLPATGSTQPAMVLFGLVALGLWLSMLSRRRA